MTIELPEIVQKYVDASNTHNVPSILTCFADDAVVRDENETRRGKIDIERWLRTTIEKYKFQYRLLKAATHNSEIIVAIEVSGTFPGSPVTLDYHFTIANNKIASLIIDS